MFHTQNSRHESGVTTINLLRSLFLGNIEVEVCVCGCSEGVAGAAAAAEEAAEPLGREHLAGVEYRVFQQVGQPCVTVRSCRTTTTQYRAGAGGRGSFPLVSPGRRR